MSGMRRLTACLVRIAPKPVGVMLLLVSFLGVSADKPGRHLWTDARMNAMVRIEVFSKDFGAKVGSAFLVQGLDQVYVLTSAHVFGQEQQAEGLPGCTPFSIKVELYQRERSGERLEHDQCAWLPGRDLALVAIHGRPGGYPTLELRAREFHQWDEIFIAGYPNGYELDTTTAGIVRSVHAADDLVMTNALSLPGMSGGPYLSERGFAVGLHTGGVQFVSGAAHFTSLKRVRERLEPYLGKLQEEQASLPDLKEVANSAAMNVELGQLVALRAISDSQKRVQLWQTFAGRAASAEESQLLETLPSARVEGIKPAVLAVLEKDEQEDRLAIAGSLASISLTNQAACLGGTMSLVDGILQCGGVSNYLPTKSAGGSIDPQLIVLHSSLGRTLKQTVEILLSSSVDASMHFLIDRDGALVQMVPANRAAWHAGISRWGELEHLNQHSISIGFINQGQIKKDELGTFKDGTGAVVPADDVQMIEDAMGTSYWHRYTGPQLAVAQALASVLVKQYKIRAITGHCVVSPRRKTDPGPAFPMGAFGKEVLGKSEPECLQW